MQIKKQKKYSNKSFLKKLPQSIQRIALRKLIMIDNAENINDLRIPPANHLEQLSRDREGQYSIRVNNQFRICFTVHGQNNIKDVEIVDYH